MESKTQIYQCYNVWRCNEDRNEAELEEEFDSGLEGEDGNDTEDNKESDDANEDVLGPEDGDEDDDDDLGYADL